MNFESKYAPAPEKAEELSPTLQAIQEMPLNYDETEYNDKARSEIDALKTSEDAFLRLAKHLIETDTNKLNKDHFGTMLRILERDSMKGHPNMELFKTAVQELAEKHRKELKLREDYWDELK